MWMDETQGHTNLGDPTTPFHYNTRHNVKYIVGNKYR